MPMSADPVPVVYVTLGPCWLSNTTSPALAEVSAQYSYAQGQCSREGRLHFANGCPIGRHMHPLLDPGG